MQALPYRTSDLRPGQVVGRDVFDVRTGMVIIRAGFELTEPVITGLARHDIRCVFVAQGPLEKEVWRATREELAVEQSARSIPQLAEVCGHLYSNYAAAGMHGRSPEEIRQVWSRLHQTVADLIREIREKGVDLAVLLRAGQEGTDLYLRSATVTYLSVLTALHLFPGEEHAARSAALAALFHDAALANEEFTSGRRPLEEHPLASAELLKQIGFNDPVAAMIVRGHHRNIDGSGYPRRQAEDGRLDRHMHHLAGIVRLAVAYCEATAGCGREQLLLPIEALGSLKAMNERFQARVFGHAELSEYLMKLSASADPAEQHLCEEITHKLRFAKEDFERKVIRAGEYRHRLFEALPPEYTAALAVEGGAFGERVLVAPEVLQAFLWVTPPFGLLDEVELSDGEVGIVIGFSPERPCLPTVRISRDVNGTEIPSGHMKIKILSAIGNERGHLRVFRQAGRRVDGCFYKL